VSHKRQPIIIKNPKKTILKLTFYMHNNIYIHLVILFLLNTVISMGIFGIFSIIDNQAIDVSVFGVIVLTTMVTLVEHVLKTLMSLKTYALITRTFGFGTIIIVFVTASMTALFIPEVTIFMVEPLVIYAIILVFLRFYMRGAIHRAMRKKLRRK